MNVLWRLSHDRISENELRKTLVMLHSAASQVSLQLDNLSVLRMLHTVRQPASHVRFGSADRFPKLANLCPRSHPKLKFWTKSKAHFWVQKVGPFLGLLVFMWRVSVALTNAMLMGPVFGPRIRTHFWVQKMDPFLGPQNRLICRSTREKSEWSFERMNAGNLKLE